MSKQAYVKAYPKEFREKVVKLMRVGNRSPREVAEAVQYSPLGLRQSSR